MSERFRQYDGGYNVKGDSQYVLNELGWWDCYCTNIAKGDLPKTLADFLQFVNNRSTVTNWIEKYKFNLIVCESACCHGALPMIRYYKVPSLMIKDDTRPSDQMESNSLFNDIINGNGCYNDDIADNKDKIKIGYHMFYISQNDELLPIGVRRQV